MSLKPTVVTNLSYRRVGQEAQLRELARYFQYRDGSLRRDAYLRGEGYGGPQRSDSLHPPGRAAKWVDRGMGDTYRQVVRRAQELRGHSVLARTWVISPDPELMACIPEERRLEAMQRLAEKTVELWYDDNGWGPPEYSYVLHNRQTNNGGRQQLHAHVVTPGTIPLEPDLGRIDHFVRRPHIRDLHETAEEVFEDELLRVLGRERGLAVLREREQRLLEERTPRHGLHTGPQLGQTMALVSLLRMSQARRRHPGRELRSYARYLRREARLERQREWEMRRERWAAEHRSDLEQARREEAERQAMLVRQREERGRRQELESNRTWGPELDLEL